MIPVLSQAGLAEKTQVVTAAESGLQKAEQLVANTAGYQLPHP